MSDNTYFTHLWKWWPRPTLPPHLPRLLLNKWHQPRYVRRCRVTQQLCRPLRLLAWHQLPRTLSLHRQGERCVPLAAYIGAYLVKIEQGLTTFGKLRFFLQSHSALLWALGFPLPQPRRYPSPEQIEQALPSQQHFSKKLTRLPNEILQTLLEAQVEQLRQQLGANFGRVVSIDTKHILAWVRENNSKVFIKKGRFDNSRQPAGDADCKLGAKRGRNQKTPHKEGKPATKKVDKGKFYWGYASGVVATKVPQVGEFVLAEMTQTFDHNDVTYFLPLMAQVEARLGFRPPFGTADAAFDAWYVYDFFHHPEREGFAAVPRRNLKHGQRLFDKNGLPLCAAGLAMPLKSTFISRSSTIYHQKGRYGCPLLFPKPNGRCCPIEHKNWDDGGCTTTMPTATGAR